MPMTRYEIRNVDSLAHPELFKAADKDDPEALLEGVAMAGLLGVLRQLGDLAEFAAEIFHGLHEEVMVTAARGHGLLVHVQQLESDIPSIERAFLSQTPHSAFFLNSGIDWHPNRQTQQNLITTGDLPRFVLDSYEECRGPPRLFLLDKFDVGGAGACLKRYTDPSVYKVDASSYENETAAYQRDKRIRKTEKKVSRWKGGETSDVSPKLHQLFLEERVQTGPIEHARRVKLKRRPHKSPLESESGESYVNKLLNSPLDSESGESCIKKLFNSPLDSGSGESGMKKLLKYPLEDKHVHAVPIGVSSLTLISDTINKLRPEVLDNITSAALGSPMQSRSPCVSSSLQKAVCEGSTDNHQKIEIQEEVDEKQIEVDEEIKTDALLNGFSSDDAASETDNYMDALATVGSDIETSINQGTFSDANKDQLQSQLSDSQFIEDLTASEVVNNSIRMRTTVCVDSDTTSTSTNITSPVGTESPPRPFACMEIPFHPRFPRVSEKIPKTEHPDGDVTKDTCNDVRKEPNVSSDIGSTLQIDQVAILEEVTSNKRDSNAVSSNNNENLDSPRRSEDHQVDHKVTSECTSEPSECLPTAVHGLSAFSFVRNLKGDVDNKHLNDTSLPMIPLSNILNTNKVDYAEKKRSTGSVVSQCSPPHAIISHVDEHPSDINDVEVEPSETTFSDDVPVVEENAENPDMYPLPDLQLREMGDGVLHESDSLELDNSKIEVVTCAVSDLGVKEDTELQLSEIESANVVSVTDNVDKNDGKDLEDDREKRIDEDSINPDMEMSAVVLLPVDFDKNEDNGHSAFEDRSVINQLCIVQESIESGERVKGNKLLVPSDTCDDLNDVVYVPDNVDKYDGKDLEYDTELKRIEADSVNSEMETSAVVLLPVDIDKNESNRHSTFEDHSIINQLCIVQESTGSGVNVEGNKLLVPSDTCDDVYVLDNVDKIDYKDLEDDTHLKGIEEDPLKSEMETSAVVLLPVDVRKNEDNGLSTFESHSVINQFCIVQESKESGEHVGGNKFLVPSDTCHDLNSDVDSPSSNPRILQDDSHFFLTETEQVVSQDLGSQPVDITPCDPSNVKLIDSTSESTVFIEADHNLESNSMEDKIDQPNDQIDIIEAVQSSPLEGKVDQANGQLYAGGSLLSQLDSLNHLDTHTESYQVELKSQHLVQDDNQVIPIHEQDLSSTPESYSVPVSEKPPTMELHQPGTHDINLFDQAKRQSTPPFLGFGILPQIAPVKRVRMPPLPPLPPVQWRMRTPPTYGDRHSDDYLPSSFLSTTNVEPQVVGHSKVDEIRSQYTENQKSQHDVGRLSQMSSPVSSLHIEDHDNSSVSSEAMVPQTDSCSIPTTYGKKVFSPSANTYSPPPVTDKKPDNFPPVSPSTPNEDPEVVGHSTVDEIRNLYTENQKSQHGERSSSQMSLPTSSLLTEDHGKSSVSPEAMVIQAAVEIELSSTNHGDTSHSDQKSPDPMSLPKSSVHTEDHDKPSVSSEAKFPENLVLQAVVSPTSGQENISPSSKPYSSPPVIDEMPNKIRPMKIQRPRSPLIVAVHDKIQLKKVSDGATTQTPKGVEHDSILDQIRAKSFKLKPAVQTRPTSIQGPGTNLRVAAILEKANAIRQAFAGSDDDDSDDWSD